MADPQLRTLAKHCREQAASDTVTMSTLVPALDEDMAKISHLTRRRALWLQLADEIDAYLNGDLEQTTDHNQLTLDPG